jgi:hypothetical protein
MYPTAIYNIKQKANGAPLPPQDAALVQLRVRFLE